jgi:hypothetical protein
MFEGIYLIQEREFIKCNENVYTLGRSHNLGERIKYYPKESKLLLIILCKDSISVEKELIKILTKKFKLCSVYGSEYFQGNLNSIIKNIETYFKTVKSLFCKIINNTTNNFKINDIIQNNNTIIKKTYPIQVKYNKVNEENSDNECKDNTDSKVIDDNEVIDDSDVTYDSEDEVDNNDNIINYVQEFKSNRGMIHCCKYCNFKTSYSTNYRVHISSKKHKNNILKQKTIISSSKNINTNLLEKVIQQNEELKKEIQQLKETNNQNTQNLLKNTKVIKKSLLNVLNSNYGDTPSIDYIKEDEFKNKLEQQYKLKIDDINNKLFMKIFSNYKDKKLIISLCNVIVRIIKKKDQKQQSVFNTDVTRGNYVIKIKDIWYNDVKGLQLKKYTIDVVTKYMINIMDIFREKLDIMYNENQILEEVNVAEYIIKYRGLLLDVNAFITNANTHKRIILELCPQLRFEE